jgi:sorbitol-specific phosphotransferase system component IIBC
MRPGTMIALILLATALCGCSDRPSIAARATVETFYSAVQNDNLPVADDNIAQTASPEFRARVEQAASAAQTTAETQRSMQVTRVDQPVISGATARVGVQFADGRADTVTLRREGERWKVVSTGGFG